MSNKEYKKVFYEGMYGTDNVQAQRNRNNLVDVIYHKLKRFEFHREDAVARLAPRGMRLLDIGCGSGSFIFKVKEKFKEIHGVDIASNRIDEAQGLIEKEYKGTNIYFRSEDVDKGLTYKDGYFDVITCIATFEHIYDPYFVIKEINRILRSGGTLLLEVPNIAWLPRRISFLLGNLPKTSNEVGWDGGHLHYFTVSALKDFLEEQGYRVQSVSGAGIFSNIRNVWVSLLSGDIIIKAEKI